MILHINAKIKALNWKPDAESVIQLEANLRPSEVQQIAAFGGTQLVVQLLKQQEDMFDHAEFGQPGLFDQVAEEDLPVTTGPTCAKCGGDLVDLICQDCGQRYRAPSSVVEKQEPVLCGQPARFSLAAVDSRGEQVAAIAVCEAHLDVADPEHAGELDDVADGATCDWILTEEEIAERAEAMAEPAENMSENIPDAYNPDPPCICGHPLSSHSIGLTCLDCNCMAFRPIAEYVEPEMEAAEIAEASR